MTLYYALLPIASANALVSSKNPTTRVMRKPYMRIVVIRGGRSHKNEVTFLAQLLLGKSLQLPADSLLLIILMHCQIGQIARIMKICHGTRDTHQLRTIPGCYQ